MTNRNLFIQEKDNKILNLTLENSKLKEFPKYENIQHQSNTTPTSASVTKLKGNWENNLVKSTNNNIVKNQKTMSNLLHSEANTLLLVIFTASTSGQKMTC